MTACISVTDADWIASLEDSGIRDNVNFWRKDVHKLNLRIFESILSDRGAPIAEYLSNENPDQGCLSQTRVPVES
jgi:hypothetical protein